MQTRDQRYANAVYAQVSSLAYTDTQKRKYGSMAHKLPVLIRTAGLAQALAFVDARGDEEQKTLLAHLAKTLNHVDAKSLLDKVRQADVNEYIRLTNEAMAALLWYKRFAQSVLKVELEANNENKA
jgi:CRISPR-associated protein Cmr5